ncbi:MAG: 3-methyl-2-oxobutanoate hydroxymethyltransferase [Gammaproteobacteria bacterium]|nr:3-methyl-2-oxobutanoate hydroxymethyltransferase [Gammaproteobacteria bacterium]
MARVSAASLQRLRRKGEKIACLTAYDAGCAAILDSAGVEVVLVGDSLGMVLHGEATTLHVRMQDMIYHTRLVRRGVRRALLATDLPFLSYATPAQALGNAGRLVREAGAEMVKLEGGAELTETVRLLVGAGIPVCGHLGLRPQSVLRLGGHRAPKRKREDDDRLLEDALALQEAGAALLVLECVPAALAQRVTAALSIPTIGIGAGPHCDGQVLVLYDLLGIGERRPSFSRDFLATGGGIRGAVREYVRQVKDGGFPGAAETPA